VDQSNFSTIQQYVSFIPLPVTIPPQKNLFTFIFHMFLSKSKLQIFKFLHNCHHLHAVFQFHITRFADLFSGILQMVSLEDSRYLKSYFSKSGFKNAVGFWVSYCHLDWDFTIFWLLLL
jgi:hypothetical protein